MADSDQQETRKGRPLSRSEVMYQVMLEELGSSMYMHVAVIDSSHVLSPDDVRQAFRVLVSKQEAMQMRMEQIDEKDKYALRYVPCEDVDNFEMKVTEISNKDDWVHLTNEENYIMIEPLKKPLFKVIMATVKETGKSEDCENGDHQDHRYVIILKIHHSISDAKGAFDVIYRQFLPILSAVVNKGDPEGVMPFIPLSKSMEQLFGMEECTLPWYLKLGLGAYRWKNRTFGAPPPFYAKYPDDHDLKNMTEEEIKKLPFCHPVRFGKEPTTQIMKSAKEHSVSVHSVLVGACSMALCETCQEAGLKVPAKVSLTWPIDLRKYLDQETPLPLGLIHGNGASTTKPKLDFTHDHFWKMCKQVFDGIKKQTKRETLLKPTNFALAHYMMDAIKGESVDKVMTEFGFTGYGGISNLGNCDVGPKPNMTDGDVTLCMREDYFAVSGISNMKSMPFFHCVTTFEGQILWDVTYNKTQITNKFVRSFGDKVQQVCAKYCK